MQKMQVILISVLFAVTTGLPQGYNYNQPLHSQHHNNHAHSAVQSHSPVHLSGQTHSSILTPSHSQVLQSHHQNFHQKQQVLRPSSNLLSSGLSGSSGGYHYGRPTPPQITKNIYIHTAPEEPDEDEPPREVVMGSTRKHYKVIFIRAPVQKVPKLSVVPQKQEDRTLIYVLSKKTDASDIQISSEATPTEPSKPEVYFIKYKTAEEAAHAQNQIQAHYDKLGGTTQISDEVITPIQSVIGSYNLNNNLGSELALSNQLPSIPQHNYLPPRI